MLKPDLRVGSVTELTPELLRQHGIKAVMVDLDDTVVPSKGVSMELVVKDWFRTLTQAGFSLLVLANGQRDRVAHWAGQHGIPGLSLVGKPVGWAFGRWLRLLGSEPGSIAMVGDQLFTDVLGANLMGEFSILVISLSHGKLPLTRMLRRLGRCILLSVIGGLIDLCQSAQRWSA